MVIGHTLVGKGSEGVIVNHGWFGGEAFEPMIPSLDTDTFTYAFMDCRGYTKSKDIKGEYTIDEIAGDVIGLAEHLDWSRFHLIGHSMGGKSVCRVAMNAGDRVKSAIVLNPVPAAAVPFDEDGWKLFSGAADEEGNRRGIIDFTTGNRLAGAWLDMMAASSVKNSDKEAFRAYLIAWAKTDFAEESKVIKTPMLVLVGEHDPVLGADAMKDTYMAWYENAELEILLNAGHYPMQETPVHLATVIDNFMKKHV